MITVEQLKVIMPNAHARAYSFVEPINDACDEFEINTPKRQAAFLAQLAHESGELRYVEELASGEAYEGREDLGNTQPGDGKLYKGRGLIQITGRANYAKCGGALGTDFVSDPQLLESFGNAARSAGWFWKTHGCNELADADNFRKITLRINGGLTHYDERVAYWEKAKEVIA